MFRPIDYNALDQEFRTGKPLRVEIRRWIVGFCLSGEIPRKISPTVGVTYGVSHLWSLSNVRHMLLSIELFRLMKPSMFRREMCEMLLNNGVGDGRNLPALSTVNKGIKIQLHIINK